MFQVFDIQKTARFLNLAARRFSSEAKKMQVPSTVEGVYANALYQVAKEKNFNQVTKEIALLKKKLISQPALLELLETPVMSSEQKKAGLDKALDLNSASQIAKSFFHLVADNRRLGHIVKVLDTFDELVKKHNETVVIEIISADTLSSQHLNRIVSAVKKIKSLCNTENVEVKNKVDPSILGGIIVNVDDKSIDISALSKVNHINRILTDSL